MFDVVVFRSQFPEFADTVKFPDTLISLWADVGEKLLSVDRWGDLFTHGQSLFVAHNISLAAQNIAAANDGGIPGAYYGVVASKTVGPLSISYENANGGNMSLNAGHWEHTIYGIQYIQLARMIGAGALQL